MSSLVQAKTLGGIGSIFLLLSIVPYVGVGLGLVGLALILIAVKYVSDSLADKSIFNNMLISVILAVVGMIVGFAFAAVILYSYFRGFPTLPEPSMFMGPWLYSLLRAILLAIIPIWIFYIASAIFLKRSYDSIANKLNIAMFSTTALLFLIGVVLAIVLIGFIIIFVAAILQTVAFFSITEEPPNPSQP